MLLWSYFSVVLTDPGGVPPNWRPLIDEERGDTDPLRGSDFDGSGLPAIVSDSANPRARYCRKCNQLKPPRCHHCSVCELSLSLSLSNKITVRCSRFNRKVGSLLMKVFC